MQAAAQIQDYSYQQPAVAKVAVTELHGRDVAFLTHAIELGTRELVLRRTPADTAVGRHAWLEVVLPDGPIKVLARVVRRSLNATTFSVRHMWPSHNERYQAFVGS